MRIQVSIDFGDNTTQTYQGDGTLSPGINVSNGDEIFDAPHSYGYKGFQLSGAVHQITSTLDGTYKLFSNNGYPGFVSKTISNNVGDFSTANIDIIFYISGTLPTTLYVNFDKESDEYATAYTIYNYQNGQSISNTNYKKYLAINLSDIVSTGTEPVKLRLRLTKWSKPYRSAKITSISANYTAEFTGRDLINVECSENMLDSQLKVSPGICEQFADINIYDRDKFLHDMADAGKLMVDKNVTIAAIDDDQAITHILGTYLISDWKIQGTQSEVGVICRDRSYILDKLNLVVPDIRDRSVDDMLQLVFTQAGNASWKYLSDAVARQCKNIITPDNWFYTDTLLNTLNKICQLGMLRIYWYIDSYIVGVCY